MGEAPKKRGFAGMTPEQRSNIASMGGKAAHAAGTAHQFTPKEAAAAGHLGGLARQQQRKHKAP